MDFPSTSTSGTRENPIVISDDEDDVEVCEPAPSMWMISDDEDLMGEPVPTSFYLPSDEEIEEEPAIDFQQVLTNLGVVPLIDIDPKAGA